MTIEDYNFILTSAPRNLNRLKNKTILLTGGNGFLGSAFKSLFFRLNNEGWETTVLSIDKTDSENSNTAFIKNYKFDMVYDNFENLNINKIDYIINCAGNASPAMYARFPIETMDVSTIGTKKILELGKKFNSVVLNFSSSEVIGNANPEDIPSNELVIPKIHSMNERAPYDVTKLYIETLSWVYYNKYDLNVKVIRPFNIIGYFSKKDKRVISNYMNCLLNNESLNVFMPGTQTRTFCFYTDFIIGALIVLLDGSEILYNIGNSKNEISIIDLANKIALLENKSHLVKRIETPNVYRHEPQRRCPDTTKVKKELAFEAKISLDEMLKKIYVWSKNNLAA